MEPKQPCPRAHTGLSAPATAAPTRMPRSQTPFPLSALSVLVRTCAHVVLPLPTLVAGRAYVELLRDRAHLETSGPSSSARPPPPRRNRQGRRSQPTIGYAGAEPCSDAGRHPRRTRAPADAAGAVALREPLLRQGRSMPLRALAYFRHRQQHPPATSGPARHAHATCRAATTVLLHPRRPAARAAYLQSMQWRH